MEKLISKGGFRERANRQRKYQNSENQQTTLKPHRYASTQSTEHSATSEKTSPSSTKPTVKP